MYGTYLALGDRVIDVDGREQEGAIGLHLVEPLDTGGGFFGDTDDSVLHLVVPLGIGLQAIPDDAQHDLELRIVGGSRVGELAGLLKDLLGLDALVNEKSGVAAVVDDEIGAAAGAPVEGALGAPPVFLEGLTLPGEDGGAVAGDGGGGMVLGGEDVAGAPADLGAEGGEGLDEDGGLDGHVEGAGDPSALEGLRGAELGAGGHEAGHFNLRQLDFQSSEIGLRHVLHLVLPSTACFLNQQRHLDR